VIEVNTFYRVRRPLLSLDSVNTVKLNVIFHSIIISDLKNTHVIIASVKPRRVVHEDNNLISR